MSRAQVTAEWIAEIRRIVESGAGFYSRDDIRDLLTALSCEQERADAAERQLVSLQDVIRRKDALAEQTAAALLSAERQLTVNARNAKESR